jgi:hypothetical protein
MLRLPLTHILTCRSFYLSSTELVFEQSRCSRFVFLNDKDVHSLACNHHLDVRAKWIVLTCQNDMPAKCLLGTLEFCVQVINGTNYISNEPRKADP